MAVMRSRSCAVAFVVQPGERNSVDQRILEAALWERRVRVLRVSLNEVRAYYCAGF
jgi:hypothetical protein